MRRLKLTRLVLGRTQSSDWFAGDRCPQQCFDAEGQPGVIGVYSSRRNADDTVMTHYLKCRVCGWLPENKLIEESPPRRRTRK